MAESPGPTNEQVTQFVQLLRQHDRQLFAYIFSQVPHWADAEDLLQETTTRLWEQFEQYELGTDFGAWSRTVARYLILAYRSQAQRSRLLFQPDVVELLSESFDELQTETQPRLEALAECLQKLTAPNRDLLQQCYAGKGKISDVTKQTGRTPDSVYSALGRMRRQLHDCIESHLNRDQ